MVTSQRVALGSGVFASGVKTRIVGPAHRNVPATAGLIEKNGAVTSSGRRPIGTIGCEKRMRISAACARLAISPVGCAVTTLSGAGTVGCAQVVDAITTHTRSHASRTLVCMLALS